MAYSIVTIRDYAMVKERIQNNYEFALLCIVANYYYIYNVLFLLLSMLRIQSLAVNNIPHRILKYLVSTTPEKKPKMNNTAKKHLYNSKHYRKQTNTKVYGDHYRIPIKQKTTILMGHYISIPIGRHLALRTYPLPIEQSYRQDDKDIIYWIIRILIKSQKLWQKKEWQRNSCTN